MQTYRKSNSLKFLSFSHLKSWFLKIWTKNNKKIENKYKLIKKFPIIIAIGRVANMKIVNLSPIFKFLDIIIRNKNTTNFYTDF